MALTSFTAFIFAEKTFRHGKAIRFVGGVALMLWGVWMLADPGLFPAAHGHWGDMHAGS